MISLTIVGINSVNHCHLIRAAQRAESDRNRDLASILFRNRRTHRAKERDVTGSEGQSHIHQQETDAPQLVGRFQATIRLESAAKADLHPLELILHTLYDAIRDSALLNASIKRRLHDGAPKPFAIAEAGTSDLIFSPTPPSAGNEMIIEISALDSETLAAFAAVLAEGQRNGLVYRGGQLVVTRWNLANDRETCPALTSYDDLLARAAPASMIALRFVSPFAVRSGRELLHEPALAPRHFFGGYFDRWKARSPGFATTITRETINASVTIAARELVEGDWARVPRWNLSPSYKGEVVFRLSGDEDTRRRLAALAQFAEYCGTGQGTAWGLGQTRVLCIE